MSKSSLHTRRIAIAAILLSIALVLRLLLSFYIPLFGENGMRVSVGMIFAIMPAILFGPVYGAIVAGLFDLMGFLLRPVGAFMPLITLSVVIGGFLRGWLWLVLKNRSRRVMRLMLLAFALLLLAFGVSNLFFRMDLFADIDPQTVTVFPIGAAVFGLALLGADLLLSKWLAKRGDVSRILPLLITIMIAGLTSTTITTVVLREILFPAWQLLPFWVVWVPRMLEAIVTNTVFVYFVALLLGLFERQERLKELVR